MEAVAKHDFQATSDDELSFTEQSILKILNMDDPNWYHAEYEGQEGLVPSNYIEMMPHEWYHGRITRKDAERLLADKHEGAYLVRVREDFALSVQCGDGIQHFKILKDAQKKFYLWAVKFDSLNKLVEYHHSASVSRSQDIMLKELASEVSDELESEEESESEELLVQALYDFTPDEDGDLDFQEGDVIRVTDTSDENWWAGEIGGSSGLFPAAYVTPYQT